MELLWVEIKPSPLRSRKSQRSLLIGCCYRPPHLAVTFYENLETVLDKVVDMNLFLLGDFNAKILNGSLETQLIITVLYLKKKWTVLI